MAKCRRCRTTVGPSVGEVADWRGAVAAVAPVRGEGVGIAAGFASDCGVTPCAAANTPVCSVAVGADL